MWDMIKKEYSFEARAKQLLDIVKIINDNINYLKN